MRPELVSDLPALARFLDSYAGDDDNTLTACLSDCRKSVVRLAAEMAQHSKDSETYAVCADTVSTFGGLIIAFTDIKRDYDAWYSRQKPEKKGGAR